MSRRLDLSRAFRLRFDLERDLTWPREDGNDCPAANCLDSTAPSVHTCSNSTLAGRSPLPGLQETAHAETPERHRRRRPWTTLLAARDGHGPRRQQPQTL